MNKSFGLSLDVHLWNYRRSLKCDQASHTGSRSITFSCFRASGRTDFRIDDQQWNSEITVTISAGSPFALDPPEPDFGRAHAFALGYIYHYPGDPEFDLEEFVCANLVVPEDVFSELLVFRTDARLIQITVGGAGASLDFDAQPRWSSSSGGSKHLFVYDFSYNLSPLPRSRDLS
jgi:hypothetical protein